MATKPGLGKGLGKLLNGDHVAGQEPKSAPMGRGLTKLVVNPPPPVPAEEIKPLLPAWFFFAADLLLLAFTVAITFDAPKPMDFGTIAFCAAAITVGATLGIAGVLRA